MTGQAKRIVVTGASGLLGGWVMEAARRAGHEAVGVSRDPARGAGLVTADLEDGHDVAWLFDAVRPDAIVHCAAMSAMDACARAPEEAARVNGELPARLAVQARDRGAFFVHVSTDLVFDGERAPYDLDAEPRPGSTYGRTKAAAEPRVLAEGGAVARTSLLFGPSRTPKRGFFDGMVEALRAGRTLRLFEDEWRTAVPIDHAARVLVRLAERRRPGLVHVAGERLSRAEMGARLAAVLGVAAPSFELGSRIQAPGDPRPRDVSLEPTRDAALDDLVPGTFDEACRRLLG